MLATCGPEQCQVVTRFSVRRGQDKHVTGEVILCLLDKKLNRRAVWSNVSIKDQ